MQLKLRKALEYNLRNRIIKNRPDVTTTETAPQRKEFTPGSAKFELRLIKIKLG